MTKVINLFGGPGTGKSTTAAGLFAKMKLEHLEVEFVTEYAKDMTWEKRYNVLGDQLYMLAKQNRRLQRLKDQVDWVITDSSILVGMIYCPNDYLPNHFRNLLFEVYHEYENINVFFNRGTKYNPVGRNQTEEDAKKIDKKIKDLLDQNSLPYHQLTVSPTVVDDLYKLVKKI